MSSKTDDKTIIESITNFIDSHLTEVRLSVATLGLIGVGVVFRSVRLATKFMSNQKIPKSFVKKNISLRGVVKGVETDGTLNVEHIPIIRMPWHSSQTQNNRLLNVSFAAIDTNISGVYWLKLNIEKKIIWFKIIDRFDERMDCIVWQQKKMPFNKNLSVELVERGLAVVRPWDQRLASVPTYKTLHKLLVQSQTKAQRKNTGLWYKPTKLEVFGQRIQRIIESLKGMKNIF